MPKKYCPSCDHQIRYDDPQEGEETACPQCGNLTILDGVTIDGGEVYKFLAIPEDSLDEYAIEPSPLPEPDTIPKGPAKVEALPLPEVPEPVVQERAPVRKGERGLLLGIGCTLLLVACFFVYVFLEETTRRAKDAQAKVKPEPELVVREEKVPAPAPVPVLKRMPQRPRPSLQIEFPQLPPTVAPNPVRKNDESYQQFVTVAFREPYRLFGNTVTDLRPLDYAVRNGVTQFAGGWNFFAAQVESKLENALVARLIGTYHGAEDLIYLTNAPGLEFVKPADRIGFFARAKGAFQLPQGATVQPVRAMKAYDFGGNPSALMIERVNEAAAKRDAGMRADRDKVAREAEAKRRKEQGEKKAASDRRAVAYLEKRIKQGSASAEYSLGLRYLEGRGVAKSQSKGMKLLESAARKKNNLAVRKLAELKKR
jgi:Zn-finger nucleic acid-binding protein